MNKSLYLGLGAILGFTAFFCGWTKGRDFQKDTDHQLLDSANIEIAQLESSYSAVVQEIAQNAAEVSQVREMQKHVEALAARIEALDAPEPKAPSGIAVSSFTDGIHTWVNKDGKLVEVPPQDFAQLQPTNPKP